MFFIFLLVVICELGAVVRYCLVIWNSVWVLFDFPLFLEQNLKIDNVLFHIQDCFH